MPISFTCKCGKRLKVADKFAGKQAKCPECGTRLVVPAATPPESPEPVEVEPVETTPPQSDKQESELDLAPPSEDQLANLNASTTDFAEEPGEEAPMGLGLEEPSQDQMQEIGVGDREGGGMEIGPDQSLATPDEAKDYETVKLQEKLQKDISGAPPAGEEVPAGMKACPSCGAYCEGGAVMCVQCGRQLEGAEPSKKPEAPAAAGPAGAPAKKKTPVGVIVGIIVGAVVLIGLIVALGLFALNMLKGTAEEGAEMAAAREPEEAGPAAEGAEADSDTAPEPKPTPGPKPEPPPPPPEAAWSGFSDPVRQQHAALWRLGAALRAHIEETGGPPSELRDLIEDRAVAAGITFLDTSGPRLQQFAPLAHTTPSQDRASVLFSDGTVRPMRLEDLEEAKLHSSRDGLLSGADIAVLAELAPRFHVENERFATLQVLIDEEPVGEVPFQQKATFSVTPGSHEIQFGVDDDRTDPIRLDVARGVEYFMVHPAHVKLPIIPLRTYRSVFVGQRSIYKPERNGRAFTELVSEFERVVFPGGDGRLAIPQTMDSVEARIERRDHMILGRSGSPIGVSEISRIRDGLLRHQNGQEVTYYASKLGTLALEVRMNTAAARLAELHLPEIRSGHERDEDYDEDDEDYYEARRRRPRRDWREVRRGEAGAAEAPDAAVLLEVSGRLYEPEADFQRLSQALRHSLAGLTPTVVRQVEAIGRTMKTEAEQERDEEDDDRAYEEEDEGRGGAERRMPTTAESVVGHELTPPAAMPEVLPPETILAQVAMLGDPAFVGPLFTLRREAGQAADRQSQYLFALARCSGANSLAQLGVASETNPGAVAVACTTVDNPAADSVLVNLLRDATVPQVAVIAEGWPVAAGPSCRRAFIQAVARAMPASLEDARLLNALQKLDPYSLEEVLLARFQAEFDPAARPVELPDDRDRDRDDEDEDYEEEERRRAQAKAASAPHSWSLLAAWNNPVAVEKMVELTEGDDTEAARKACVALSRTGDESMVDVLAALLGHGDKSVRSAAAWSLVRLGHPAGLDHVRKRLEADMVSETLIEQAGKRADVYGRQRTAEFLVAVIGASLETPAKEEKEPDDRREYWEEEEEFLQAEKPKSLTAVAIRYAGELGVRSDALVNALQQATRATAADGRIAAYRHLARLRGDGPQPDLAAQALTDSDPEVRKVGLSLLHGAASTDALTMLRDSMQLPNADVREAAIRVVPTLTDPMEAVGVVVRGIADQDYRVMQAAAQTAMTFEGPVPPLGRAIANRLNALRGEVAATAGEGDDWLAREERRREREEFEEDEGFELPGLQRDPGTPAGRIMLLADAAGALRASEATAALQIHLTSPDAGVRMAVTEALAKIGDPGSVHALMQMLDDADPTVRSGVVQALVQLNVPAGNEALISRLNDNSLPTDARRQVLGLLARLAADDAAVQEALTDSVSLTIRDLDTLAELAETAPKEHTAGYRMIARIYLRKRETRTSAEGRDGNEWEEDWREQERARARELELEARWDAEGRLRPEEEERRPASATAREAAGRILANLKDDPEAAGILREAFDRNPSGLYEAMAGQVTAMNREGKLQELQELYKELAARAVSVGGREEGAVAREALRRMRESIVNAVVAHGGEEAPAALRRLSAYEKQPSVRRQIVAAFGRVPSKDSVHYLVEFAMRDETYYGEVAEALGKIGQIAPDQSRGMLGRIRKSSRSGYVEQAMAADALDRLDRTEATAL